MYMRFCLPLIAALSYSLLLNACTSTPVKRQVDKTQASKPAAPTPLQLHVKQLADRIAAGEKPPVDIDDPKKLQLVYCEKLSEAQLAEPQILIPVLGYACQNNVGGKKLLRLRKWQCGERTDEECICGIRDFSDFRYNGWRIKKFYGGRIVSDKHKVESVPCRL